MAGETDAHIPGKEDLEISMLRSTFFCTFADTFLEKRILRFPCFVRLFSKSVAANSPQFASGMLRFSCFENLAYQAELLSLIELAAVS